MKKTYISPEMMVIEIETEKILAGSSDSNTNNSRELRERGNRGDYGDDDKWGD